MVGVGLGFLRLWGYRIDRLLVLIRSFDYIVRFTRWHHQKARGDKVDCQQV